MILSLLLSLAMSQSTSQPGTAIPSPRQLEWQKLEYYAFVHFGPNTFADQEWGHGTEDPNSFNPTALDCRQWVRTFKEAGMKQVIITAKHHDGFCLWPSTFSKHTVAQSKWRDGKGDVLAELRKACDEYGMKMGVYLSPWDRNHPDYGTPKYNQVFADMLKEVLTKYGPIYEVWFDGANGEGPNGKKQVYDWNLFNSTVRKYAPNAVIFGDGGPDIRWVGNEQGHAPETCWSTITKNRYVPGTPLYKELGEGTKNGHQWTPAECDVSIRPGWFYHKDQDNKVKSPEQLLDLYERSVGRNASFLLNVPPDHRGLIHENDVKALLEFRKAREAVFGSPIVSVNSNPPSRQKSLSFKWAMTKVFDRIVLEEDISKGHQTYAFKVFATVDGKRKEVAKGTNIGSKRILRIEPTFGNEIQIEATEGTLNLKSISGFSTPLAAQIYQANKHMATRDKRLEWWREARFGMFIHWGLYSVPGGVWNGKDYAGASEWLMNSAKITAKDYHPLQAQFNPIKYNAKRWVQIAKDAGMKYIVITSKHHDGFGLFDSKYTDWDVMGSPFKRDILKELAAACKEGGIKLCFYHSIMDWTHPDYGLRRPWDLRSEIPTNMERYTKFMKNQLKELLTNYGDIGILWFDGEWEPQAWNHERGVDLYNYVLSLQPKIIVNNRVDVHRSGMAGMSANDQAVGDYGTPEQEIPANGMPGLDWESCMTMNGSWGYAKNDHNWKSAETLVHNVIDCASKGGNYLLNVGPTDLGEIPEASVRRLAAVGAWMKQHGATIYGSKAGPFTKPQAWGRATVKGSKLYLHLFNPSLASFELAGLEGKLGKAYRFLDKKPVAIVKSKTGWTVTNPEPKIFIKEPMPEVFVVEFTGKLVANTPPTPPLQPDASGNMLLKAIDATTVGSAHYEADEAKQCIGFWTGVNDVVSWKFGLKRLGNYAVQIEYACEDDTAGSEVEITIGGKPISFTVAGTGSWSRFSTVEVGSVGLAKTGIVTVSVKASKMKGFAVMNLRSVKLTAK